VLTMSNLIGQRKRATVLLTLDGAPAASNVAWRVMRPDGSLVDPTATNPQTGTYVAEWDIDQDDGPWEVRFEATGSVVASAEETVSVENSPFF